MSEIRNGVFVSGKFVGQPKYAPYFWQQVKDGLADEVNGNVYLFDITPKDIKKYPELSRWEVVRVYDEGGGFITVEPGYE